jgi:hypothetical protein
MPDMRKPLLYGGGVLGILLVVALAWSMWPKILFSFEKSPTVDEAKAQLLKQAPSALPVYVSLKSVDDISLQGTSDGGATFQFSATAQTNETLYEKKSMTMMDEVKALNLSDRLNDLEKRNSALPDNLRLKEAMIEALMDSLPPLSEVTAQAGQNAQIKGTLRVAKGSGAWNWMTPQFDTPPSDLFPGTIDNGTMQSADVVRATASQRLDVIEQNLTRAEGDYQRLQQQQAEIAAKAKEEADQKAKAIAVLSPGSSFTGALVERGAKSYQVNLRITDNKYEGQMIQGVLSDVDLPGVQRTFSGVVEERNGPNETKEYKLNFTLDNNNGGTNPAGSPETFRRNGYQESLLIGDDSSLRQNNRDDAFNYTLFKDAPGTTPVPTPPPPFGAAPSDSGTNSTAATAPDASQTNPEAPSPAPNVAPAPPPESAPAPTITQTAPPWQAPAQAASVETPQAPPPAAPPSPIEHGPTMYTEGNFPEGNLYSIPDLASLAGQRLNNAWLYGTLVLKNKDGHLWTFHTYRVATGISLDVFGGEGGTVVEVEFPNDSFPQVHEGQVFKVGQGSPLQLLSVRKSASGTLIAKTRFRQQL